MLRELGSLLQPSAILMFCDSHHSSPMIRHAVELESKSYRRYQVRGGWAQIRDVRELEQKQEGKRLIFAYSFHVQNRNQSSGYSQYSLLLFLI